MARVGVSYDEVKAAALAILATGEQPSLRSVRDALGRGSNSTISGHMARWRATEQPIPEDVPAPDVSAAVAAAIQDDKERAIAAVRAPLMARIASMEGEAQLVRDESNAAQDEIERLLEQVATLTTERDQAQALAGERAEEIRRLSESLAAERAAKDAVVLEAATLRLKTEAQAEHLGELKDALASGKAALDEAAQGRQAAEKTLAGVEAREAAERARADDLAGRLQLAQEQATAATADAKAAAEEAKVSASAAAQARVDAKEAQSAATATARELSAAQEALKVAQAAAQTAQSEAAGLRGQLAELRAQLAAATSEK